MTPTRDGRNSERQSVQPMRSVNGPPKAMCPRIANMRASQSANRGHSARARSLEVGFLQDGELDLELRRREAKNQTERANVAYRHGVTAWVPRLQRELEALGGRPHWGLAHSLSNAVDAWFES